MTNFPYLIYLILFFSLLWLAREVKASLFWIYLWQLKEYHLGRFLDHFKTEKGRKIFSNQIFFIKIVLFFYSVFLLFFLDIFVWQFIAVLLGILFLIYLLETYKFLKDILGRTLIKPVFTLKALSLSCFAFIL